MKLRLPNAAAHQRLSDALSPYHVTTHVQENIFFDGVNGELTSVESVLRVRFYNNDSRCVLSLKAKARLVNGISRVEEQEEDIQPDLGRELVMNPRLFFTHLPDSRIMEKVRRFFAEKAELLNLGGFRNVRGVFLWKEEGLTLELDETRFDFGTSFELECETNEPEKAKVKLEMFLRENGVEYSYSKASKFAIFRAGRLLN